MSPVWCHPSRRRLRGRLRALAVPRDHQPARAPRSPRAPRPAAGRPAPAQIATVISGAAARPRTAAPARLRPPGSVGRRQHRDHHRRLGLPEQLPHHRPEHPMASLQPGHRHRRRAVPKHCNDEKSVAASRSCAEQHVDQRRGRKVCVTRWSSTSSEEPPEVGRRHDLRPRPPRAMIGKHSTPAAWVSGAIARYTGRPSRKG